MINKEKLLLLATIYMLLPGAVPEALADSSTLDAQKNKSKKSPAIQNVHKEAAVAQQTAGGNPPAHGSDRQK
jgi:hypothetical protein